MKEQLIRPDKGPEVKLVMVVTYGCPQRCTYCVIEKHPEIMSPEDLSAGIDYVMGTRRPNVQIHFFGGEPLLMPLPRYREAVEHARRRASERGKSVQFVVTTGGVLLAPDNIDFFVENGFNVEISIDGAPMTQNYGRPVVGPSDAYTTATRHLKRLFTAGADAHVSMVVTAASAARFRENFHHMLELGFHDVFAMTANGVDWTSRALTDFQANLDRLYPECLGLIRDGRLTFRNLKDWQAPFRINTELAVSVEGEMTYSYNCCLVRDHVRPEFSMGPVRGMERQESFDQMYDRRMTNEECIPVFFKHAISAPQVLRNNIEAGMLMTRFVQSLKEDLGLKDELYFRNALYQKAYERRVREKGWYDPEALEPAAAA